MSKQQAQMETQASLPAAGRLALRLALWWGAVAALVAFAWVFAQRAWAGGGWGGALVLATLHAALSLALERALVPLPVAPALRYRLAFILSAAVYVVHWALLLAWLGLPKAGYFVLFHPLIVVLAAFLGALFATGANERLWENNSPPSADLSAEVYAHHRAVIGASLPEPAAKRIFDFTLALLGLLLASPVWMLCIFLIWWEDPGPLLFVKNSVGKGGVNFRQLKLRTMVRSAEDGTGPVPASEDDQRVLAVGRLLRKTALDELPQLLNILRGEMSFVGPRPQRTVLVLTYLERMPEYAERHQVLPGLAGLAQVAGDYYLTPRQKLRFDRVYIRHCSLGFDLKLLLLAFLITFWYRWQPGWNGRLPRRLLRLGS